MPAETIELQYGTGGLPLDVSGLNVTVLRPTYPPPLADEAAAFRQAVREPITAPPAGAGGEAAAGIKPLAQWVKPRDTLAIAIPDITRALPNRRLLEWVFAELPDTPADHVTIIAGTGTHRGHTDAEWHHLVGRDIHQRYRCVDHRADDPATLAHVGTSPFGYDVSLNRAYARADRRLLLGFIEPHFMAGFSGGYKACFPGVAGVEAIMHYHNAANIGHPRSTWGVLDGNPTQAHLRAAGALGGDAFLLNVTLDERRRITGFFCGDPVAAHEAGCAFCRDTAMQPCDEPFPLVVTSNSGYPLDQNLYQAVKGMAAAAEAAADGGLIIAAARCNDGFPSHGNFKRFLFDHAGPTDMLDEINAPGFRMLDQWQVQKLAVVLERCRVSLYSDLPNADVKRAHLTPIQDIRAAIDAELHRLDPNTPIAILPEGPLTIPYLRSAVIGKT